MDTLLVHVQLCVSSTLPVKRFFLASRSQHVLVPWVAPQQLQDFTLLLLSFTRFLSDKFSSLLRFLWQAVQTSGVSSTPPSFVLFASLLKVFFVLSSRSLCKILNSIYPSANPEILYCGWPPVWLCTTDHHPWVQPFSQLPVQLTVCLICASSVCLWGYYLTQCKQSFLKLSRKTATKTVFWSYKVVWLIRQDNITQGFSKQEAGPWRSHSEPSWGSGKNF